MPVRKPAEQLPQMAKSMRKLVSAFVFWLSISTLSSGVTPKQHKQYLVYVGTYTEQGSESKGIYGYRFDATTERLTPLGLVAKTINPSFLASHSNRRFLYAVNEVSDYQGQKSGAVSAFAIDRATGKLTLLDQVASRGGGPCYITVDKTGKYVLVANYDGGSVAVFPTREDGSLGDASSFIQHTGHGTNPERQEAPHAHSIDMSPDDRFAIVDDLGLDETLVYPFDGSKGSLSPDHARIAKAAPGAGPRHFAMHPSGKFGYVINEMGSTLTVFDFDSGGGTLKPVQTISTIPKDFLKLNEPAEIEVAPSGKYLYASNRGHDSIAVFAIDPRNGTLSLVEYIPTKGTSPRHFEIAPGGSLLFVENEKSDNIVLFHIDRGSGRLTPTGAVLNVSQPVCMKFVAID
jgi:6-phosphogluconolactonase